MRRRARGIVGLVVLSLGLGVVTTYGVAWWSLNCTKPVFKPQESWTGYSNPGWSIHLDEGKMSVRVDSFALTDASRVFDIRFSSVPGIAGHKLPDPPEWSLVRGRSPSEFRELVGLPVGVKSVQERAAGWPWLAVVERFDDSVGQRSDSFGWRDLSIRGGGSDRWNRTTLAFLPLWNGFLRNVAVYGMGWLVLIGGLRLVVQRRRVAVGHCPKCRYDLSGLASGVCPECGSAVKGT